MIHYQEPHKIYDITLLSSFLFAAVVIVSIFLIAGCGRKPDRVADYRETLPRVVNIRSSESMKGFYPGDKLSVSASDYNQIQPGDPVFVWYENAELPYFHIAVRKVYSAMPPHTRWLVHGDNNQYPDEELLTELTYIGRWEPIKK